MPDYITITVTIDRQIGDPSFGLRRNFFLAMSLLNEDLTGCVKSSSGDGTIPPGYSGPSNQLDEKKTDQMDL
ncbi:hypothetical protein BDV28DRAFT_126532 [Aspergillus coremiiformis]|uniref:Uncharacterized protein n=1 Tax=Aspergillus coremiiformis TaxID=138285 RepID=A0A5N6ZHE7_9EURO|nr:hypothetical protein BDV28DRAFT_126532 [Aspergillus coremiiformis]